MPWHWLASPAGLLHQLQRETEAEGHHITTPQVNKTLSSLQLLSALTKGRHSLQFNVPDELYRYELLQPHQWDIYRRTITIFIARMYTYIYIYIYIYILDKVQVCIIRLLYTSKGKAGPCGNRLRVRVLVAGGFTALMSVGSGSMLLMASLEWYW